MAFKFVPKGQTEPKTIEELTEREAKDILLYVTENLSKMTKNPFEKLYERIWGEKSQQ